MSAYFHRTRLVVMAGLLAVLLWPGAAATRPATKPSVTVPAAGVLLVAKRDMLSPSFTQSVVLLIKHDAHGSLGVILNRPTRLSLQDALPDLDATQAARHTLFLGGPVAPQAILLLMRKEAVGDGVERVMGGVTVSTHSDVLQSLMARKKSPTDLRAYIGCAGWAGGQLEAELARGAWYLAPATEEHVFGDDEELWEQLIDELDPPGIRVRAPSQSVIAVLRSDL